MNIRHANLNDLDEITYIEQLSFSKEEGASKISILKRLETFADYFWLLENDNHIIGFINGMVTNEKDLMDEMYDNALMHDENGMWQMIFSVAISPQYRHLGYASKIMNQVIEDCKNQHRLGIVLTCKNELISFYEQFGFKNEGISKSIHGNVIWYQMRLTF